jgi:hypothetical protein
MEKTASRYGGQLRIYYDYWYLFDYKWGFLPCDSGNTILNKQSRLSVELTTPHRKNKLVTKCHKGPRTWTDSPVDSSCEQGNEPSGSIKCWEVAAQLAASQEGLSSVKLVRSTYNNIKILKKRGEGMEWIHLAQES